jgi:CheY-like chemotaxis protein
MSKTHLILVVDDDHEDIELFKEALHDIDPYITCVTAFNGNDALELLNRMEVYPDYIFLDLNMPCLNGKQCLGKIKTMKHLEHIPVIIYSTSKAESDIEEVKELGATYFLTKPTKFEDIKDAIAYIISSGVELHIGRELKKMLVVL